MIRIICVFVVFLGCQAMQIKWADAKPSTGNSDRLPALPSIESARAAYNDRQYVAAVKGFREAARIEPQNPLIYRALARACAYAEEAECAVRAYRHYLNLSPEAQDHEKIKAEMALVARKLTNAIPPGPPPAVMAAIANARERAEAGEFTGSSGALGLLSQIEQTGYVGPEVALEMKPLTEHLMKRSEAALDAWFKSEALSKVGDLAELSLAWDMLSQREINHRGAKSMASKLEGLIELSEKQAEQALVYFGETAPTDYRIRFAQALALLSLSRNDEAKAVLSGLSQGPHSDPRFEALLALTEIRMGEKREGQTRLKELLEVE